MEIPEVAKKWVNRGIYLLKNEKVVQPRHWNGEGYAPVDIQFKVKNLRPILYFCICKEEYACYRVNLYLINSVKQFENKQYTPRESLTVTFYDTGKVYFNSYPEIPFAPEDFIFLGVEEKVTGNYWRPFYNSDASQILNQWEGKAVEQGYFTPGINPLFKSKADKEEEIAKDFFGQEVKRGDTVAYVMLTGSQRIRTGKVTNITIDNFVINKGYVAPHKYVIKCPEGFKPKN